MRRLLAGLFILIFFIFVTPTFAQTPTPEPDPCLTPETSSTNNPGAEFETKPAIECMDEAKTKIVEVTFHVNEENGEDFVICTGDKDCLKPEGGIIDFGIDKDDFIDGRRKFQADGNGNITVKVCGDGSRKVKLCENAGSNYFHGGNIYYMSVGLISDKDFYKPVAKGGFYIARSYPTVEISPNQNITTETPLTIKVKRTDPPLLGGKKRNNFQLVVEGGATSIKQEKCFSLVNQGAEISYPYPDLRTGTYLIKISEQDNERSGLGNLRSDGCQGGFTYYHITCTVTGGKAEKKGSCTNPSDGKDPKGQEYRAFLKDLAEMSRGGATISFPCRDGKVGNSTSPADCNYIETAIGKISITPQGFIESIFRIVLFLATFGGIIIIIYSGYMLMISRGDKEKVAGARETITSAIVGLLFIILSIVILEIIGVQILRLPGFGP